MTTRAKRSLIVASAGLCSLGLCRAVLAWASDLPNRINVYIDVESVNWFIAESVRATV